MAGSRMEYKQFNLQAFEREPGKWRANVRRGDGKPVKVMGREKLVRFVTKFDASTAAAAIGMAMAVIDAGVLSRDRISTEKIWRLSNAKRTHSGARCGSQDQIGSPDGARNSRPRYRR